MPIVLAMNPGSNSLKFDLIDVTPGQSTAADGKKLLSGAVDNIGKHTKLDLMQDGTTVYSREADFKDFHAATAEVLHVLASGSVAAAPRLAEVELVAVRVVHGGDAFESAVALTTMVEEEIKKRKELAPLHNVNSLAIIDAVRKQASDLPIAVAFDTAFHHTMPEYAWRYPIERETADRYGIRRFGFHGLSHRYMVERFSRLVSIAPSDASVVTLHLESGASAAAIQGGRSVDTSMGLTPLEGLMMGTRSGSVDPSIVPFLVQHAGMSMEQAMELLEKRSGLLGVSGSSLDTRELRKQRDASSQLALKMFGYRARQYAAAYLSVVEGPQAVIFGGGIGENTPEVRKEICAGLRMCGLQLDEEKNERVRDGDEKISAGDSRLGAWVIHVEEGMQLAHECWQAAGNRR